MLVKERDRLLFHISIRIVGNTIVFNSAFMENVFSAELIIISFIVLQKVETYSQRMAIKFDLLIRAVVQKTESKFCSKPKAN